MILIGMSACRMHDQIKSTRGGKRAGSGRKKVSAKKIRISTSLDVDVIEYLHSRTDKPKAQIIEEALREHKLNFLNKRPAVAATIAPVAVPPVKEIARMSLCSSIA